jgi:hypothetical protein
MNVATKFENYQILLIKLATDFYLVIERSSLHKASLKRMYHSWNKAPQLNDHKTISSKRRRFYFVVTFQKTLLLN